MKERDEFYRKSIKTGAYWVFPIVAIEMFNVFDQYNLKMERDRLSIIMNYYYLATSLVCTILFMLAYCNKRERLILPGYILIATSTVIRMLDFDNTQAFIGCEKWTRHQEFYTAFAIMLCM